MYADIEKLNKNKTGFALCCSASVLCTNLFLFGKSLEHLISDQTACKISFLCETNRILINACKNTKGVKYSLKIFDF